MEKKDKREQKSRLNSSDSSLNDSESTSSFDSSSDEEDFATITQKIKCKFTIKAMQRCYLLQMEKKALEKMTIEFPEIWQGLAKEELGICGQIIVKKAQLIRTYERLKKYDQKQKLQDNDEKFGINVSYCSEKKLGYSDSSSESVSVASSSNISSSQQQTPKSQNIPREVESSQQAKIESEDQKEDHDNL